ncbi:MAG: GNAT family N-acetyltransferase [Halanaerobiales bacterium]|nr:GNAT family N-acetyltransferase [Halanaerobiales bacterium]
MLTKLIKNRSSAVALNNNTLVGYMTGFTNIPTFKGEATGVYTPEWGHSSMTEQKEDVYYKLYRYLSKEWVSQKFYTHVITYFANDTLLYDLLYQLCFGMLVIDGVRSMDELNKNNLDNIIVRQAVEEDIFQLQELDEKIDQHLNDSPVFLYLNNDGESIDDLREQFLGSGVITFVAEKDGKIVSGIRARMNSGPGCQILQVNETLGVNFVYTSKAMQGLGIASNLLSELLKWGSQNNMKRCTVDFESQNREAKNFWLRHFKPICYSAIRKVDDRI